MTLNLIFVITQLHYAFLGINKKEEYKIHLSTKIAALKTSDWSIFHRINSGKNKPALVFVTNRNSLNFDLYT